MARKLTDPWQEMPAEQLTSRHLEMRRLADATRSVISRLVATKAPEEALAAAADRLEQIAAELAQYPHGSIYEGFAEAANAGGSATAFVDHSPMIGKANPLAPPIAMEVEERRVIGRATFGSAYEGPPGCVHGGWVAASFDEVLGAAQSISGLPAMTGRLTIHYRKPTPLHREIRFVGEFLRVEGRKVFTEGKAFAGDVMTAEAEGLFITIDFERFSALVKDRDANP